MFIFILGLITTCLAAQKWATLTSMPTPRSDLSAVVVNNAFVLVAGGCVSQTCPAELSYCTCQAVTTKLEAFYPTNSTWITLAPLPRQRFRHGAAVVNGKMYLIGGRDNTDTIITEVDVYDIATNTWTTNPTMNWLRATSDLVVVFSGNFIYTIGGYDANYTSVGQTCFYNTPIALWDCNSLPELNEGRGDACGAVLNNQIFIVGGFSDVNFCSALDTLEVYDMSSRSWVTESRLHDPRADSACVMTHEKFHVVGGEVKNKVVDCNKYDIPVPDVEYYNLENNTWIEEVPIPDSRFRFAGVAWGGGVMLIGGQGTVDESTGVQPVLGRVSLLTTITQSSSAYRISIAVLMWFALFVAM